MSESPSVDEFIRHMQAELEACEEMPAEYLYHVEEDDPAIQDMIAIWEEE